MQNLNGTSKCFIRLFFTKWIPILFCNFFNIITGINHLQRHSFSDCFATLCCIFIMIKQNKVLLILLFFKKHSSLSFNSSLEITILPKTSITIPTKNKARKTSKHQKQWILLFSFLNLISFNAPKPVLVRYMLLEKNTLHNRVISG